MGLRATAIRRYEVLYGDVQGFNYDEDTLSNIISSFCDCFYCGSEYPDTDVIWEIDKGEFEAMLKELDAMDETEFDRRMREEWTVYDEGEFYTKEYVTSIFRNWLRETEDKYYVRLGWL